MASAYENVATRQETVQPAAKPSLLAMGDAYNVGGTAVGASKRPAPQPSNSPAIQSSSRQAVGQAELEQHWQAMFEPATLAGFKDPDKIVSFLKDVVPQADADGKTVAITLGSSFAEYEVKKVLAEVMTYLRRRSGVADLTPRIEVHAEERAAKPYQSGEKYEAMLQLNPMLAELRKVLPDIDI